MLRKVCENNIVVKNKREKDEVTMNRSFINGL